MRFRAPKAVTNKKLIFLLCLFCFSTHFVSVFTLSTSDRESKVRNASHQKASFDIQLEMPSLMSCSEAVTGDCIFTDHKATHVKQNHSEVQGLGGCVFFCHQ